MLARRVVACSMLMALAAGGCGTSLPLPTESPEGRVIPSDKSYQMLSTWTGMKGVNDILLTQGSGAQLFLLFNTGGTDSVTPRGDVQGFPLTRPTPFPGIDFPGLFNPVALCSGAGRVYVLDQGDTLLARLNPITYQYGDTTGGFDTKVNRLGLYWRVRQYGLLGGLSDTSSFTDTTLAFVRGVAADAQGRVYVSGTAIISVVDQQSSRLRTRTFQFRIYRYVRGPRYPGVPRSDENMPGCDWHRDSTWVVEEGSGIGSVVDPRGLSWGEGVGVRSGLYAADFGKNWVQKLSDSEPGTGFFQLDGGQTGRPFFGPMDVCLDLGGFIYIADTGNQRVLRYGPAADFVQVVNVEPDADGESLRLPVAVAANDSLVYVGDRESGKVIRYKRRP